MKVRVALAKETLPRTGAVAVSGGEIRGIRGISPCCPGRWDWRQRRRGLKGLRRGEAEGWAADAGESRRRMQGNR